ncbi:MAG TPA: cell surface protein [Gammaproteobacteria bacterium]|nr:cell surface protein [Gammaproteobacteria bacterium]
MSAPAEKFKSPAQYLDRAMNQLRDLGLVPAKPQEAPIVDLLNRISDLDQDRVVAIARTLSQASLFNEVVREQLTSMKLGERYDEIASSFNSIRDDAKGLVDQLEDGKIGTWERLETVWMKVTRGDISDRFEKIKRVYLDVARDSKDQIEREHLILNAYMDFRGALKQAEVEALEVLKKAELEVGQAKAALEQAAAAVQGYAGNDAAERARLELARDERLRDVQRADDRYQLAKDISDNLTIGYNTSEVIMARLNQTTTAKERVYKQAIAFFGTNETVLTALSASFTGLHGLHESTQTLEAMKRGVSDSLEDLADIGGKVQEEALRAGYGPTIRMESVKKLVDAVVSYQERSHEIIEEMRTMSTRNANEIRDAVEDGKKRVARLAERVAAAPPAPAPRPAAPGA